MRDIRARHGEPDEQPLLAVDEPTELPADDALEVAQLKCDLTNRTVIGQAMGILMQHYALPDDQALAPLVTQSRDSGIDCVSLPRTLSRRATTQPCHRHQDAMAHSHRSGRTRTRPAATDGCCAAAKAISTRSRRSTTTSLQLSSAWRAI